VSEALTLGKPTDYDAMCAAGVARALHLPQRMGEIEYNGFPAYADRVVRWEHLSGGMSSMHTWGTWDALESADGALLNGYLLELRGYALLPTAREEMLAWSYKRATSPEVLRSLVRTESLRKLVDDVEGVIRNRFDSICSDPAERSWRWRTATYKRFHAGAVPWRLSFGAWPVLPILDRELMETMLALPRAMMASRQLADGVMRREFPALARLPLDRNAHDVRPLAPSLGWKLRQALGRRLPAVAPAILRQAADAERRYYVRIYDFDNAGWRAVRGAAEHGRDRLAEWFDPVAIARIVPEPALAAGHSDTVLQGFLPKMLVGFMRRCVLSEAAA
jgi:asparagine synthase (glutamine-hydrolysing)